MEFFYLEEPSIKRRDDAIKYIEEHYECSSNINGSGSLDNYLEDKSYSEWLDFINEVKTKEGASKYGLVPSLTYFLVRKNDNKIIGMINIRLELNERLKVSGGHIGYGIRPTERGNGYNKINLYLGLQVCKKYGIKEVFLDAYEENEASWKTMESLGGVLVAKYNENGKVKRKYSINVDYSLENYEDNYFKRIYRR